MLLEKQEKSKFKTLSKIYKTLRFSSTAAYSDDDKPSSLHLSGAYQGLSSERIKHLVAILEHHNTPDDSKLTSNEENHAQNGAKAGTTTPHLHLEGLLGRPDFGGAQLVH